MLEAILGHLAYQKGLYALLALVPLILIYLIKPKPKKKEIPALMFLLKERTKSHIKSFFQTLLRDWLLILQIIVLIAIAVALAKPFINVTQSVLIDETVLIIDDSASSQTKTAGTTRFNIGIETAKELLASKNTVILASGMPQAISEHKSASETRRVLSELKPKDTSTNLYDAILMSANYISGKGRVVVVSDFIETETGLNYKTAARMVETQGIEVVFKDTSGRSAGAEKSKNIGMIDLEINDDETSVTIKSFNEEDASVKINVDGTDHDLEVPAGSVQNFVFDTLPGVTKITLIAADKDDDFLADNTIYVSMPEKEMIDVLLITNDKGKYLHTALSVIDDINLQMAVPPKVPEITSAMFDVIIIKNIDHALILPGTIKDIKKSVGAGAGLIITVQPDLFQIDYDDLLPVKYESSLKEADVFAPETLLTQDVNFGHLDKHFNVSLLDGGVVAYTLDETPIIVLKSLGLGNIMYYGIFDEDGSNFKYDMYYPIFWKRAIDLLSGRDDPSRINFKTGQILSFDETTKIQAPTKTVKENLLVMDEAGVYAIEEGQTSKTLVANLLNERESDINGEFVVERELELEKERVSELAKLDLTNHFLIAIMLLIFLELLIIKFRGDI